MPNPSSMLAALKPPKAAPVTTPVRKDSDGDFDGTKVGGFDARDFGKGVNLDRLA
jgi:hypothetical protein